VQSRVSNSKAVLGRRWVRLEIKVAGLAAGVEGVGCGKGFAEGSEILMSGG